MPDDSRIPAPSTLSPEDRAYSDDVGSFCREAVTESTRFLEAQKGYKNIQQSIDAISGETPFRRSESLSSTSINYFSKVFFDVSGSLTDQKPFWDYDTDNKRFDQTALLYNKYSSNWYARRHIGLRFGDTVKYALVGGCSYNHQFWNKSAQAIDSSGEDPRDVFPFRPASTETCQDAKGMLIRRARPLSYIRKMYPKNGYQVKAELSAQNALSLENTRAGALYHELLSPWDAWKNENEKSNRLPSLDIAYVYTVYLDDDRRNNKSYPVQVGQFGDDGKALNNWSYIVQPKELLYPRKRCIVYSNGVILYDGPSMYWHGLYPLCKLTLDPMPWSWLGKGPMWDLLPLQKSLDSTLRALDDHIQKVVRPAIIGDRRAVSRSEMKYADARKAGLKMLYNASQGKPLEIVPTPPLDPAVLETIKLLEDHMDRLSGSYDMSQMTRLNQIPSDNTLEKIANTMSTIVRARSRAIEAFTEEFAQMLAFNIAQFVTMNERVAMMGQSGVTPQDFDTDPGSFIPDYVHGRDFDSEGHPTAEAIARGPLPRYDRAREFLQQFVYRIAPNSQLSSAATERKLMYLQLARAGLIDHWTLLDVLGIPNAGSAPDWAPDITSRLLAEKMANVGMQVSPEGRKASGDKMPTANNDRLAQKES